MVGFLDVGAGSELVLLMKKLVKRDLHVKHAGRYSSNKRTIIADGLITEESNTVECSRVEEEEVRKR